MPFVMTTLLLLAAPTLQQAPLAVELVDTIKIWDAGKHNAFTDLIRWKDRWYCTFREGDAHVGGDGKIRVLTSTDGKSWTSAALIGEKGIDLRDPKLSITPDGKLMIVAGGSVYEGKKLTGRQPRTLFSDNGTDWTPPQRVLEEGEWLWRVTWHGNTAYGVSYNPTPKAAGTTSEGTKTTDWALTLVKSTDGKKFEVVTPLNVPGHPNETTLRFTPQGEMIACVRREAGDHRTWIGTSSAPYTQWTWKSVAPRAGGPNFIQLPDGRYVAVVRLYDKKVRTSVCSFDPATGQMQELQALPSGGDTSYAGIVFHDNLLWVSYYSSHEKKTNIYLSKLKVK